MRLKRFRNHLRYCLTVLRVRQLDRTKIGAGEIVSDEGYPPPPETHIRIALVSDCLVYHVFGVSLRNSRKPADSHFRGIAIKIGKTIVR